MKTSLVRKLIPVEIRLGFLSIPSHGVELMPSEKTRIIVNVDGTERSLAYNPTHRRIFGLTSWYKGHSLKRGDDVILTRTPAGKYALQVRMSAEIQQSGDNKLTAVDVSGLSSQAKGDIVEDRIKELILLQGHGLLSIYKPVTDTEGIDLIVVKNGNYTPIFLQVKARYSLHGGRSLIVDIHEKTFTAHTRFFVVAAYFNPETSELHDTLLLVPSKDLVTMRTAVTSGDRNILRIVAPLSATSGSRWNKFVIKKSELAEKLFEKFEHYE